MKPNESVLFEEEPNRYRAIFISDIHLGTRGCKAEFLLDFLRWNESKHLYLVGDIEIKDEAVHRTVDGRDLWVTHGDLFDGVVQHAKWLAYLGDSLYSLILRINHYFNQLRNRLGFSYWSLSQYLKHKVKNAVAFITEFEEVLASEAQRRGYDGVICGHIHRPEIRDVNGTLYCNDGDWVESLSALVETNTGELKLVHWPYRSYVQERQPQPSVAVA